ncbi:MAG: LptF/LptG family permease [Betaproteobacteria bacterium]|nr:LptF/LptG family permease [Betaproteobacteria bacterium]
MENLQQGVTIAQRGFVDTHENGYRYLVMLKGRRYEGLPGQADYKVVNFERYSILIEQGEARAFFPSYKSKPTPVLLRSDKREDMAELVWRFGLPASTLVLAFFAIPLSAVNPRTGRSFNLILAALLYLVYNNLVSAVQSWVERERFGFVAGLTGLNLAMALICAALIYHRLSPRPFYRRGP